MNRREFKDCDIYAERLAALRPLPAETLKSLREYYRVGLTYTSNALEGNSLTESETKVVIEDGLTIGGKPLRDIYEATGHAKAYDFLYDIAKDKPIDEKGDKINFLIISIGIDYGATEGETEFKATGITPYFQEVWTLDEEKLSGLHSPDEMYERFAEFYKRVFNKYGKVTHVFADYGALGQVITFGLNRYLQRHAIPIQVQDCIKGRIVDRIELDCHLFGQMRRFILRKCKYLIEAYSQALWDDKHKDERLDDGTTPIDDLDASEYSIFPFYDKLMSVRRN